MLKDAAGIAGVYIALVALLAFGYALVRVMIPQPSPAAVEEWYRQHPEVRRP